MAGVWSHWMVADRARSNSVISQASPCLCVRLGCLFEQGDWTSHCPSGMIRPASILPLYTDTTHTLAHTYTHTLLGRESLSHHPMSSLSRAALSIERETRPPRPVAWKHTHRYKYTLKRSKKCTYTLAPCTRARTCKHKGGHTLITMCTKDTKRGRQKHDASVFSSCPGSELALRHYRTFTELKTRGKLLK